MKWEKFKMEKRENGGSRELGWGGCAVAQLMKNIVQQFIVSRKEMRIKTSHIEF